MADIDKEVLRRFGIRVLDSQFDEVIKIINSTPVYKEEFQKIKNNIKQLNDQDYFLNQITKHHKDLISDKITLKDSTFHIQAIDPEEITSLTQRAFFKSFNIQKNKLNDLTSQKHLTGTNQQAYTQIFKINTTIPVEGEIYKDPIIKTITDNTDKAYCICGKQSQTERWVQCERQNCKGSSWYHYQCVGFTEKDKVEEQSFICNACKAYDDEHAVYLENKDDQKSEQKNDNKQENFQPPIQKKKKV